MPAKSLFFPIRLQLFFYVCKILILSRVDFLNVFINALSAVFWGSEREMKISLCILQSLPFCILCMCMLDI